MQEDENVTVEMSGKTIGEYQLLELIGHGDTWLVYRAFQPTMNRYVAVKTLRPALANSTSFLEQFRRRLSLIASLKHSNILPLYDQGVEDGVHYVVTRYVEDGTLEHYLPDYYAPRAALRLIQPIAEALEYAHERGLVHANLRPENILIDEERRPLLANFAATMGEVPLRPLSGPYASPELVVGEAIDRRTDVFGLGALLYTLLIGEAPPERLAPIPRASRPDLSPAVEKVILKAMATDPRQRFQSAGEFNLALRRALQPGPDSTSGREYPAIPERKPVPGPAAEKQQERTDLANLVYISGTLALFAGLAVIYFIFFRPSEEAVRPPTVSPHTLVVTVITTAEVRTGPGSAYEVIGILQEGEKAETIGVGNDREWWVIKFPAAPDGRGWIRRGDVSARGIGTLPIVDPPPLPAASPSVTEPP